MLCRMIKRDPSERPRLDELLTKLREIRKEFALTFPKPGSKEGSQCLLLTSDETLATLARATLKEYGFKFGRAKSFDEISRLSEAEPTIAWFVDLDGISNSVTEIIENAMKFAPDAKVVFFSTRFDREMVEDCVRMQATALLVKPLLVPRLVQTLNSLSEEPELIESESLFPFRSSQIESGFVQPGGNPLHVLFFECGVCKERFGNTQFKPGSFEFHGTETDFCPICKEGSTPELYSIVVCPSCLYANFAGRFQKASFSETAIADFLASENFEKRAKVALDLDFQTNRSLKEGLRSFELAAMGVRELEPDCQERLVSEIFLKASWLCRRLSKPLVESDYQSRSLECLMKVYSPYILLSSRFPGWEAVKEKLRKFQRK